MTKTDLNKPNTAPAPSHLFARAVVAKQKCMNAAARRAFYAKMVARDSQLRVAKQESASCETLADSDNQQLNKMKLAYKRSLAPVAVAQAASVACGCDWELVLAGMEEKGPNKYKRLAGHARKAFVKVRFD